MADWPCEISIFLGVTSTLWRKKDSKQVCKTNPPITAGNENANGHRFGSTIPGNAILKQAMIAIVTVRVAVPIRAKGPVESTYFRKTHQSLGLADHFGEYQMSFS